MTCGRLAAAARTNKRAERCAHWANRCPNFADFTQSCISAVFVVRAKLSVLPASDSLDRMRWQKPHHLVGPYGSSISYRLLLHILYACIQGCKDIRVGSKERNLSFSKKCFAKSVKTGQCWKNTNRASVFSSHEIFPQTYSSGAAIQMRNLMWSWSWSISYLEGFQKDFLVFCSAASSF